MLMIIRRFSRFGYSVRLGVFLALCSVGIRLQATHQETLVCDEAWQRTGRLIGHECTIPSSQINCNGVSHIASCAFKSLGDTAINIISLRLFTSGFVRCCVEFHDLRETSLVERALRYDNIYRKVVGFRSEPNPKQFFSSNQATVEEFMLVLSLIGKIDTPIADAVLEESRVQFLRDDDRLLVLPEEPSNSR